MDGFSVDTHLNIDDWSAYQRAFQTEVLSDRRPVRTILFVFVASLVLGFGGAALLHSGRYTPHFWELAAGMLIAFASVALRMHRVRRTALPLPDGVILGAARYEFDAVGIRQLRAKARVQVAWSALRHISITPQHLFLWIDRVTAYIVPVRDLPPGMDAAAAAATLRALAGAATNDAGPAAPESSTAGIGAVSDPDARATQALARADAASAANAAGGAGHATLLGSLRDALRVYAYVPLRRGVAVHQGATLLLGLLAIALWIALDGIGQDEATQFSVLGINGIACYMLSALAVAWVMALRTEPSLPIRNAVWILAVLAPLVITGVWLASFKDPPWSTLILAVTALLAVFDAARVLRALTGESQWRAALGGLAASVLLWLVLGALFTNASVWYPLDVSEAQELQASDVGIEGSLYEQPAHIDSALAAVAPHTGAAPQAYMLGFAGVGEQRVFAEEIKLAANVLGQRYGSTQRSLLLINDQRDLESHPLATVTGLDLALRGMAQRMDPAQDILFLVLSSHGSQDASIAVSNGGTELNQLDADSLADALQESGIRYKVIIISACYAGSFIPALSDENTIILTAAAADRTSFGCGSERDLTYFGEAFFRDALPGAPSLAEAFKSAAAALAKRELQEHETPSRPQAYFGTAIMARLAALEPARAPLRIPAHQPQVTARLNP